jgi:hypothetical protein
LISQPETGSENTSVLRPPSFVGSARPSSIVVAGVAGLAAIAFLVAILAPQRFDLSALVNAGRTLSDSIWLPPSLTTIREGDGYDGQFFYRLGLDPFTNEHSAEGLLLDMPAYRHQRILYPLLGWALSLGRSTLLGAALAFVNVVSIVGLAWWGSKFAALHGRSPLWGLALVALPACAIALANDLSEILLAAAITAAAFAIERRWSVATTVALSLAVLAHEHGMVLVLALALVTLGAPELRGRGWWLTWLIPSAIFVGLQVQLALVWGETPMRVAMTFLGSPFRGALHVGRGLIHPGTLSEALYLGGMAYFVVLTAACVWALRTTNAHRAVCLGWMLASVLLILGNGLMWNSELSFWRVATLPMALGFMLLIGSPSRLVSPVMLLGTVFGSTMAARLVWAAWHA